MIDEMAESSSTSSSPAPHDAVLMVESEAKELSEDDHARRRHVRPQAASSR
jgi:polyribonucleotide nucleotidyltransferase